MDTKKCTQTRQKLGSLTILLGTILLVFSQCGQQDASNRPSPLSADSITVGSTKMSIVYSSPRVRGRKIWDKLVKYGEVWRTGANEATIFETTQSISIDGRPLPPGKYAVFTIPGEKSWTIMFNKSWEQWGAYGYDPTDDIVRVSVSPSKVNDIHENMEFIFSDSDLTFRWEHLLLEIPIEVQ